MRFSTTGLIGILLAIANAVAAILRYANQGLLEILVVVVYAFILLLANNAHDQEPTSNNKKWLISLFVAGIINLIAIIFVPLIVPIAAIGPNVIPSIIIISPIASLIIGTLFTFLLIQG